MTLIDEANRIKDRLRACTTVEQVDKVADEERDTVLEMKGASFDGNAMFHQIRNLKIYRLRQIERVGDGGSEVFESG